MKRLKNFIVATAFLSAFSVWANGADLTWLAEGVESGQMIPFSFAINGLPAVFCFHPVKARYVRLTVTKAGQIPIHKKLCPAPGIPYYPFAFGKHNGRQPEFISSTKAI